MKPFLVAYDLIDNKHDIKHVFNITLKKKVDIKLSLIFCLLLYSPTFH